MSVNAFHSVHMEKDTCCVTGRSLKAIQDEFYSRVERDPTLDILMTYDELQVVVRNMAYRLNETYKDASEPVHFLGLLSGAYFFMGDLTKYINFRHEVSFIKVSSYHGEQQ